MFDDGFIYLRIVRQIRVGHGPVFNDGERVEAFTGPLWVAVLAISDLVTPVRLEWLAIILGIAFTVLGAGCAIAGSIRLVRLDAARDFLLPVGIVVFAALVPTWYFETSGLETGLAFGWLGACACVLASWATSGGRRLSALGSILIGLGWLVRPELVVYSAVFVIVVSLSQWRRSSWRQRFALLAWAVVLPAAYQLFRMGYYGSAVANTAIAKEGARFRAGTGSSYMLDFVRPYWLWIPVGLLVLGVYLPLAIRLHQRRARRAALVLCAFLAAGGLNAAAVVAFGGDYIHGRLLLPALFALCAPVAVVPVTTRYIASLAVLAWALMCALALRPPQLRSDNGLAFRDGYAYVLPPDTTGRVTLADSGWEPGAERRERFDGRGVFVVATGFGTQPTVRIDDPAPGLRLPLVVSGGIGALGYALGPDVSILDINGLADPLTGHLELVHRGQPGHEKVLPTPWIAARVTADGSAVREDDFPIAPSLTTPAPVDVPFVEQVAWAREALRCSEIADLERATEAALTPRRFLNNMLHAFSRSQRRVPADPHLAALRFCEDDASSAAFAGGTESREHAPGAWLRSPQTRRSDTSNRSR
jgi:arabinofuranosyltransferase